VGLFSRYAALFPVTCVDVDGMRSFVIDPLACAYRSFAELQRQGPRAEVARRDACDEPRRQRRRGRMSGGVPPTELWLSEALQRRTEAGRCQLQRKVRWRRYSRCGSAMNVRRAKRAAARASFTRRRTSSMPARNWCRAAASPVRSRQWLFHFRQATMLAIRSAIETPADLIALSDYT